MKRAFTLVLCTVMLLLLLPGCDMAGSEAMHKSSKNNEDIAVVTETISSEPNSNSIDNSEQNELGANSNDEYTNENIDSLNDSLSQLSTDEAFYVDEISDELFDFIKGKSYKDDCAIARDELRYLHILHIGFDNEIHEGELICNDVIAEDLLDIFKELYVNQYQIEKVKLIDYYDADDETSMRDNNTSCFNYRKVSNSNKISKHGMGLAVDINPLYNPCVRTIKGQLKIEPETAGPYSDRSSDFMHKMDSNDLCVKLFKQHGFLWGGDFKSLKDYQHFEKK